MNSLLKVSMISLCLILPMTPGVSSANDPFDFKSDCKTKGTSAFGDPDRCNDQDCFTAPSGFVIVQNKTKVDTSGRGEPRCSLPQYENLVEVIPGTGITQPTKVCVSARGKSEPGMGCIGCTGTVTCSVTGEIVKLP